MKIALVSSSYLPRFGGVEQHVSFLARELRTRGNEVVIWAVDQGDVVPKDDDGIPLRYLPSPLPSRTPVGLARFAVRAPHAAWKWWRAFRVDAPDVVNVQCFGPNGPWASALCRLTRTPLVYSNHGETFMDADDIFAESALLRVALKSTLISAAAITSCSTYAARDLERFAPLRDAVVVANGVDLSSVAAPDSRSETGRYIAGVGRLVANKGFATLIDAFAAVADSPELDGVSLVIGGDGPEHARLQEHARRSAAAGRVHFPGRLDAESVRALLDGAIAHVVPSRVEAFGIVILEGWRSRTAVLCTSRGGPPEFVEDGVTGILFDPEDVPELALKLVSIVADVSLRESVAQAGHDRVKSFTWSAVADAYEQAFRDVLSRTRR